VDERIEEHQVLAGVAVEIAAESQQHVGGDSLWTVGVQIGVEKRGNAVPGGQWHERLPVQILADELLKAIKVVGSKRAAGTTEDDLKRCFAASIALGHHPIRNGLHC